MINFSYKGASFMKYAFVTISILAIWLSIVGIVLVLDYKGILLPIVGLVMTIVLFEIGFGGKK